VPCGAPAREEISSRVSRVGPARPSSVAGVRHGVTATSCCGQGLPSLALPRATRPGSGKVQEGRLQRGCIGGPLQVYYARMRARFAGLTDVGLMRERNEDSLLVVPQHRFAAVADGMGGHLSGDVASGLAVSTLKDFYTNTVGPDRTWPFPYDQELTEEENCVVTAVRLANRQVFTRARQSRTEAGMGTTVVAIMFTPDVKQVIIGHVGDSRCYRVRDGKISQLTNDHSLVSEVAEIAPWLSEEEVRELPTNVITRALGMAPDVVVDLLTTTTKVGDLYLLCSDGLNGMVSDEEILATFADGKGLDELCEMLVAKANAAGGVDNTTVVVATVEQEDADPLQPSDLEALSMDETVQLDGPTAELESPAPESSPDRGA
jgi:serine/threonine protein phosphatase PrpC